MTSTRCKITIENTVAYPDELLEREVNNQLLVRIALHAQPGVADEEVSPRVGRVLVPGVARRLVELLGEVHELGAVLGGRRRLLCGGGAAGGKGSTSETLEHVCRLGCR